MNWAEAVPNLLICLREGLEAGLVVTILLAAIRKVSTPERPVSAAPVWLGLLGAVSVAASFAAVLTYSTAVLSSSAQEAIGGALSVLAVGLVTGMVFWMRRTAGSLSKQLRGEVARASAVGAGALAVTAFLAVGREGLESTLFVWTAIKAAGSTVAPLVGAALGLVAAIALCWLLYRQAVRLNLGTFFNRTALVLIVIAAGVLAYGLGDLQDAGLLPGAQWIAFDLSAHIDPNSWWVSIITGVTELTPKMTVLQVVAWLVYLAVVIPLFLRAGRTAPEPAPTPEPAGEPGPDWWERVAGRRLPAVAAVLVLVPVLAAGAVIALLPSGRSGAVDAVTVSANSCAPEWTSGRAGLHTFAVQNKGKVAGEIRVLDATGGIVGEIETLGPATTADLIATLGSGAYSMHCLMSGQPEKTSATVQITGDAPGVAPAFKPVTADDLTAPNDAYQAYAGQALTRLTDTITRIRADLQAGNIAAAQADWLVAQQDWERVGASYNSFGSAGTAVAGLPDGLPGGVADPNFTGLRRLEYGLWHGQRPDELIPVVDRLGADIAAVRANLSSPDLAGDPTKLSVRAHEILEDALRDHLSGMDDQGGGAAYPLTLADVEVTRAVLDMLGPLLDERAPQLRATLTDRLETLRTAVLATRDAGRWRPIGQTPHPQRQAVLAAIGDALEQLAQVPRLLEVPAAH
ncbi:FTR1 family protein [Nocardia terpenica]|uniref:iron uptake transporter permease EfeU n=1 Tax=Nocardia terpenica TaxID=455432 RepID=UPI0018930624|nr:iron uptake transporter permease EfeU [Nocardia terpenica]MBF6065699.1 FTR1 family protein [Nocardia terpenica]MBF6108263.1 FTR1 family protein [Nocardia terpenica]MBF6115814.1 FTR1 family protein [Nocardia terpenica]MBF6122944.1 FTR1 family protein [Nocardia terpenica]MBF6155983.1 FTR1 family protein [Nocardia terpenica]